MTGRRKNLITQKRLAELAGVSTAAACKQCNGTLKAAWDGTYVDASHEVVQKYLASKAKSVSTPAEPHVRGMAAKKAARKQAPPPDTDPLTDLPEDIRDLVDFSLRKLLDMFGTDYRFLEWLKSTKEIENIHRARLDNAAKEGQLVNREVFRRGVLDPLEASQVRMLQDGSKTIATRLAAMVEAGRSLEDREKFVHDQLSSFIKPLKARIKRALKGLK